MKRDTVDILLMYIVLCISIPFLVIYSARNFIFKYNDTVYMHLILNIPIHIILLFIALYLCRKFDLVKYLAISFKSLQKIVVFIIIFFIIIKLALNLLHVKYYLSWDNNVNLLGFLSYLDLVIVAFAEEFIFRIIFYYKLLSVLAKDKKTISVIFAIIIGSLIFSTSHFPIEYMSNIVKMTNFITIFVVGVFLSYVYLRTKIIYIASFLHFIFNANIFLTYNNTIYAIYFSNNFKNIDWLYIINTILIIETYNLIKHLYRKWRCSRETIEGEECL